jgi:hypothetical protein
MKNAKEASQIGYAMKSFTKPSNKPSWVDSKNSWVDNQAEHSPSEGGQKPYGRQEQTPPKEENVVPDISGEIRQVSIVQHLTVLYKKTTGEVATHFQVWVRITHSHLLDNIRGVIIDC